VQELEIKASGGVITILLAKADEDVKAGCRAIQPSL